MNIRIKKLVDYPTTLEYLYATSGGQIMAYNLDLKAVTYEEVKKGAKVKEIKFDKNTHWIDMDATEKELEILRNHAQVKSKFANANLTNPMFELINVGEEQNEKVLSIKKMRRVMNIVDSLNIKGIYNLCNYLRIDVSGKDIADIYVLLLDPTKGFAYKEYDKVVNLEKDEDAELTINVHKAIMFRLVEQKGNEYHYGGKMAAASLSELYFYFKNSTDLYEKGLKPAIAEREVSLPIKIQYAQNFEEGRDLIIQNENEKEAIEKITDEQLAWLKEKAAEMDVKGRFNMKPENLLKAVLAREVNILEWNEKKAAAKAEREAAKK